MISSSFIRELAHFSHTLLYLLFLDAPLCVDDSDCAANSSSNRSSNDPKESGEGILFHFTSGRPSKNVIEILRSATEIKA